MSDILKAASAIKKIFKTNCDNNSNNKIRKEMSTSIRYLIDFFPYMNSPYTRQLWT